MESSMHACSSHRDRLLIGSPLPIVRESASIVSFHQAQLTADLELKVIVFSGN
jgi:hypothetical protein